MDGVFVGRKNPNKTGCALIRYSEPAEGYFEAVVPFEGRRMQVDHLDLWINTTDYQGFKGYGGFRLGVRKVVDGIWLQKA